MLGSRRRNVGREGVECLVCYDISKRGTYPSSSSSRSCSTSSPGSGWTPPTPCQDFRTNTWNSNCCPFIPVDHITTAILQVGQSAWNFVDCSPVDLSFLATQPQMFMCSECTNCARVVVGPASESCADCYQ